MGGANFPVGVDHAVGGGIERETQKEGLGERNHQLEMIEVKGKDVGAGHHGSRSQSAKTP